MHDNLPRYASWPVQIRECWFLENSLIITEDLRRSFQGYSEHPELVPQSDDHIMCGAQGNKFTSEH